MKFTPGFKCSHRVAELSVLLKSSQQMSCHGDRSSIMKSVEERGSGLLVAGGTAIRGPWVPAESAGQTDGGCVRTEICCRTLEEIDRLQVLKYLDLVRMPFRYYRWRWFII